MTKGIEPPIAAGFSIPGAPLGSARPPGPGSLVGAEAAGPVPLRSTALDPQSLTLVLNDGSRRQLDDAQIQAVVAYLVKYSSANQGGVVLLAQLKAEMRRTSVLPLKLTRSEESALHSAIAAVQAD